MATLSKSKRCFKITGRRKLVTRDIAALSFLLSIPMEAEEQRKHQAITTLDLDGGGRHSDEEEESDIDAGASRTRDSAPWWRRLLHTVLPRWWGGLVEEEGRLPWFRTQDEESDDDGLGVDEVWERPRLAKRDKKLVDSLAQPLSQEAASLRAGPTGKKLHGPTAAVIRVPPHTREAGTVKLRQWEQEVFHQKDFERSRLFFATAGGYPLMVGSVIRYDPSEESNRLRRNKLLDQRSNEAFFVNKRDWRGISFGYLFPEGRSRRGVSGDEEGSEEEEVYEPGVLDDPKMGSGKYAQKLGGKDLGPVLISVVKFVSPSDLKEHLNHQWRERHPEQPKGLTLSKVRNLKGEALDGCFKLGFEVCTVAYACCYLERLMLKKIVTKANRRLSMATCLVIAFKVSAAVGTLFWVAAPLNCCLLCCSLTSRFTSLAKEERSALTHASKGSWHS